MRVCGIKFIVSTPLKKSWKNLAPAASQSHGRSAQGVGAGRPPELRVEVLGFRVQGLGFRVEVLEFKVQGLWFRL